MIGRTIAHYEVTSHLGKGGMGEVYRARDSKLGREVALKVLPEGFAGDAERLSRFQREGLIGVQQRDVELRNIERLREMVGHW